MKFKINDVKYAKDHTISKTSRNFANDRKRIREWIKQFDAGRFRESLMSVKHLPGAGQKVKNEQLGRDIFECVSEQRWSGI